MGLPKEFIELANQKLSAINKAYTEIKNNEKKVNYNEELSPNFSKRNNKIKYIIIHYTGTKSLLRL